MACLAMWMWQPRGGVVELARQRPDDCGAQHWRRRDVLDVRSDLRDVLPTAAGSETRSWTCCGEERDVVVGAKIIWQGCSVTALIGWGLIVTSSQAVSTPKPINRLYFYTYSVPRPSIAQLAPWPRLAPKRSPRRTANPSRTAKRSSTAASRRTRRPTTRAGDSSTSPDARPGTTSGPKKKPRSGLRPSPTSSTSASPRYVVFPVACLH